ncbi:Rv1355c family protein [Streptomyces sp. JJ36]|uniref:Rv1355c family protein n=1 Tax=Streptomyces sp. JJ36 TaxID=2736645 RepID=UPI001F01B81B|nr:Rv1355c family protein [Streptomyces sp. JJ36]MCF6526516.1 Rv1355c family protein [Streptomyces sp. JJ36]
MAMHRTRTVLPDWEPRILTAEGAEGVELAHLLRDGARVVDTLAEQLTELLLSRAPGTSYTPDELADVTEEHLAGVPLESFGSWVHYPWLHTVVRVLPEDEFTELRTSRNRHRVTGLEQERLRDKVVAVVGLATGRNHAFTLAQEGVGRSFRIADRGPVALSDLNRAPASVTDLGLPRTVAAAREMYELDPYLTISLWPEGVSAETLDDFLTGGGTADLVVEQCDDLALKAYVRERARSLAVPVLTDTEACGVLDVERFDLEPDRPVLHGLLGGTRAADLAALPPADRVPHTLRLLDGVGHGPRLPAGLLETGHTLVSRPRLASGAALGAALVADAGRRILLGQFRDSGRYHLDLDAVFRDGAPGRIPADPAGDRGTAGERGAGPSATRPRTAHPELALPGTPLTEEGLHRLVAYGILAPSPRNSQPWRFRTGDRILSCELDPERRSRRADPHGRAALVSLGAVVSNIEIAAAAAGHLPTTMPSVQPDSGEFAALLSFTPGRAGAPDDGAPAPAELVDWIGRRATHRGPGDRSALPAALPGRMERAAASRGARLTTLTDRAAIEEAAEILGEVDRLRLLIRPLHDELTAALRWTPDAVETSGDGIDVTALADSPGTLTTLRLAAEWHTMDFLRSIDGGRALECRAGLIRSASALCALSAPGLAEESWFHGGRALQQAWLTAAAAGFALHPVSGMLHLMAALERGADPGELGLEHADARALRDRMRELRDLLGLRPDDAEIAVFRLFRAQSPAVRSLRRPVADFLV